MKEGPPPSRYGRLRRLSEEEITLWLTVTRSVAPRPGSTLPQAPAAASEGAETRNDAKPAETQAPRPASSPARPPLPRLTELDRRLRQRLARGQAFVDAALDLHGMRQQEAHHALHDFLLRSQRQGAKLVLVVTGKGEGRDDWGLPSTGVLRRSVPHWLRAPEWRGLIVGFEEASRQHGGGGALYVRLRRLDRVSGRRS